MMPEDELIKLHASAEEDFDGEDTEDHTRMDEDDEDSDDEEEEEECNSSRDDDEVEDDLSSHSTTHPEDAEMFSMPSTPRLGYETPDRESVLPAVNEAETPVSVSLKEANPTPLVKAPAKKAAAKKAPAKKTVA